jgi:hypothetical protein
LQAEGGPAALDTIYLTEIKNIGQARWRNGKLLIINEDSMECMLYVYDILNDIRNELSVATQVTVFNKVQMQVPTYLNITAFDISPTDKAGVSQMFIMNRTNIAYTFTVNGSNFEILEVDTPGDHSVQIISAL